MLNAIIVNDWFLGPPDRRETRGIGHASNGLARRVQRPAWWGDMGLFTIPGKDWLPMRILRRGLEAATQSWIADG